MSGATDGKQHQRGSDRGTCMDIFKDNCEEKKFDNKKGGQNRKKVRMVFRLNTQDSKLSFTAAQKQTSWSQSFPQSPEGHI